MKKILQLMNIKLILMFCFAGNLSAGGLLAQDAVLDVRFDNSTLVSVFNDLKSRTGYNFTYDRGVVDEQARVTVAMQGATLDEILGRVLASHGYSYRIDGRVVYVMVSERRQQQPIVVRGRVTGRDGKPLVGASVAVEGTSIGTVTDAFGQFTLSLPGPATITVSYVGYQERRVEVTMSGRPVEVILDEKAAMIDDVIVTGYGTVSRNSFTGTATTITGDELRRITNGNIISALQVFDPSLRLVDNTRMGSDPNTLPEFYVRGRTGVPNVSELDVVQGTMSGDMTQFALVNNPNLPVFILDGFQADITKIYDMDINRIRTITLLKDAAATAMYGSRAANGVVVIETHAPGVGKLRVNYSGTLGITSPDLSSYDMMNSREAFEAEVAAGFFEVRPDDVVGTTYERVAMLREAEYLDKLNQLKKGVDNYWMSQPLRTAFEHKHSFFIEGGVDELRFGVDLNMDSNNGVMKGSSRERMGAGLTISYRWDKLTIQNNLTFDHMNSAASPYGSFADYSRRHPYDEYTDENGEYPRLLKNWGGLETTHEANPLYNANTGNYDHLKYNNWTNNLGLIWQITGNLRLDGRVSVSDRLTDHDVFRDPESAEFNPGGDWFNKGRKMVSRQEDMNWNANAFLAWNGSLGENHFLNARAGVEANGTDSHFEVANYTGFPSAKLNSIAYAYKIDEKPAARDNLRRMASVIGVANYSIADTYLFDASFRMDGSSEFGSLKRWAPFWALGAGLNLHKYGFVRRMDIVDFWRLRATFGETGKLDVSPYASENTYGMLLDQWYPTGIGATLKSMGNPLLTWSKSRNIELGMAVGLWQERLFFDMVLYDRTTNDQISTILLPASSGFGSYYDNIGKVRNRGVELNMNLKIVRSQDFDLVFIANLAHNKNRIIGISQALRDYNEKVDAHFENYGTAAANANLANILNMLDNNMHLTRPITKFEEGNSLTTIYGMKSLGINPANGQEVFLRRDGTITYDWNSAETQKIGDTEPKIQGALNIQARWKDLTLYTSFMYSMGGDKYNQTLVDNVENVNLFKYNADRRVTTDRWQKPGDRTQLKSIKDRYAVTRPTSRFVQKDNTLSFTSLQLGYDFTRSMRKSLDRIGIQTLRASLNMNDVAVMSSIRQERGLEYPFARTFTFTINAAF